MKKKLFFKLNFDILKLFFLISFIFVSIIWILQAVNFLDIVSEDGHSFYTYFDYAILNIPKIFSRVFLLSFFISLFYILVEYEENNQLLILWSNGISKINFFWHTIALSIIYYFFLIILSSWLVPLTLDKAREKIRNSDLSFFPSLIKQKKFIDTVEGLTVYIENKDRDTINNIFLKDTKEKNIQIIVAEKGQIINTSRQKLLILENGKIINLNNENKNVIEFKETNFDLESFTTKTTTQSKNQEIKLNDLVSCLLELYKNDTMINYKYFSCNNKIKKELLKEVYKRIVQPIYLILVSSIVLFLILKPHTHFNYTKWKFLIFTIGCFFIIMSEISVNFISEEMFKNLLNILFVILTIIFISFYFLKKTKNS